MDDVCRRRTHGCRDARWCDVPPLAAYNEIGSVVSKYGVFRARGIILRYCHRSVNILHHNCSGCQSGDLDIPKIVC